jgi:hypothetical protein
MLSIIIISHEHVSKKDKFKELSIEKKKEKRAVFCDLIFTFYTRHLHNID